MTLKLTLCHKSIHRWNQLCKGFILNHFGWVACMVHHGLLGLHLCISTIGISTTYCNEPTNYPPKRCMSATTIILTQCSKSRLPIPVFRNLFLVSKKPFLTGFLRIPFFPAFSGGILHRNVFFRGRRNSVFFRFYRNFLQEFLWAGIPEFTLDSGGFRRIPEDSCSRQIICSRQTLPQLALPPASPQCRSALRSALKGSQAVVGVF